MSSMVVKPSPPPADLTRRPVRRVSPLADSRRVLRPTKDSCAESRGAAPSPKRREFVSPAATAPRAVPLLLYSFAALQTNLSRTRRT